LSVKAWLFIIIIFFSNTYAQMAHLSKNSEIKTVMIEELTWPELDQKIRAGYQTVIIPTGGTEQGGAHMALGKHNYVVLYAAKRIASRLSGVLVAPVLPYVPEGDFSSPSGNLRFPGTLGLSQETFAQVLIDTATSLYLSGFKNIVFIGDHGQSQQIQAIVSDKLNEQWQPLGVRVLNLGDYYDSSLEERVLLETKLDKKFWGEHGGIADTSELLAVRRQSVRTGVITASVQHLGKDSGGSGRADLASAQLGIQMMNLRVSQATHQLSIFLAQHR
jgi:creatinine amidohydrolase/Fe(II)-dependent formamide hydrolase-like protein